MKEREDGKVCVGDGVVSKNTIVFFHSLFRFKDTALNTYCIIGIIINVKFHKMALYPSNFFMPGSSSVHTCLPPPPRTRLEVLARL